MAVESRKKTGRPRKHELTARELAEKLEVDSRTIERWQAAGLKSCDPWVIAAWLAKFKRADVDDERQRLTAAQADLVELKRQRLSGELVPVDELVEDLQFMVSRLRQFGESLYRIAGLEPLELLNDCLRDCERTISGLDGKAVAS
jgi:hypothetical protein